MALTKEVMVDKVEVVGEWAHVQIRTRTDVLENGKVLSSSYHRKVIAPGQDYSAETEKVKAICTAVHTDQLIARYQEFTAAELTNLKA